MYTYNDLSEAMNETWCLDCPAGELHHIVEFQFKVLYLEMDSVQIFCQILVQQVVVYGQLESHDQVR